MLGNILRSNFVAAALGVLALGSVTVSSAAVAQTPAPAAQPVAPKPEMFGNWGLVCPQPKACQIQVVLVNKDKKFVAALAYGKSGTNQTLVGIVPLGFRLQNQPPFTVDGGAAVPGNYVQCLSSGCRVAIPVTDAVLRSMQGGKQATLTLLSPSSKQMPLNFDLTGFQDAKAALDRKLQ
ncbi:invasion associated locus B family protein [Emcibacter sp. SYSU 3D8]|uniref:invasion associated locus B family protein n=1 Tax=Emcibacter sp. SYSU 3D8 TaxID=3133969 RepID=UPI0031FF3FE8